MPIKRNLKPKLRLINFRRRKSPKRRELKLRPRRLRSSLRRKRPSKKRIIKKKWSKN